MKRSALAFTICVLLAPVFGCGAKSDLTQRAQFDPDRVVVRDDASRPPPLDPPVDPPFGPVPVGAWTFDIATGAIRFFVLEVCDENDVRLAFYDAGTTILGRGEVIAVDGPSFTVDWNEIEGESPLDTFGPLTFTPEDGRLRVDDAPERFPWGVAGPGVPGCATDFPVEGWEFECECNE